MYTEFIASVLETRGRIDEAKLEDAFDQLDSDHSGFISKADLRLILGNIGSAEYVDRLIKEADLDNDGQISYDEFKQYLADKNAEHIRLMWDVEALSTC
jgi:calmodulin